MLDPDGNDTRLYNVLLCFFLNFIHKAIRDNPFESLVKKFIVFPPGIEHSSCLGVGYPACVSM